jgi:cellobiose-specific phosphotransferase system component IIB
MMDCSIETKISGTVMCVKLESQNKETKNKGASLQFLERTERGMEQIDVKIVGTTVEDLKKFENQQVTVKNVNMTKIDFNTFYNTNSIDNIIAKKSA